MKCRSIDTGRGLTGRGLHRYNFPSSAKRSAHVVVRQSTVDQISPISFLLYCTALFLTGWWIGWVLLLLIVPAGGRLDIFERERRMRMGQQTIKLIGYRSDLDPD